MIRNQEPILPMSKKNSEEIVRGNHEPSLPLKNSSYKMTKTRVMSFKS